MTKIAESGSGSISQRHVSADSDPDPGPPQNDKMSWIRNTAPITCLVYGLREHPIVHIKKNLVPDPDSEEENVAFCTHKNSSLMLASL